jgi:hypothetical protein
MILVFGRNKKNRFVKFVSTFPGLVLGQVEFHEHGFVVTWSYFVSSNVLWQ